MDKVSGYSLYGWQLFHLLWLIVPLSTSNCFPLSLDFYSVSYFYGIMLLLSSQNATEAFHDDGQSIKRCIFNLLSCSHFSPISTGANFPRVITLITCNSIFVYIRTLLTYEALRNPSENFI